MSEAREEILQRIRQSLGRPGIDDSERATLEHRFHSPPISLRPDFDTDLVTRFAEKLAAVAGTLDRVHDEDRMFEALAAHLQGQGVEKRLVAAPALQDLAWPAEWEVRFGATRGDDLVAVTPCFAAVAETGSVVLLSGAETPTSLNFLPDYHIVLVRASQLVKHIEDVWPLLRAIEAFPRSVNFISGPSKTADVEQTMQLGAHGPRSLHVIFIEH